jgi:hypothetical protein
MDKLVVAFSNRAATMRRCVDEQDCDEYQLQANDPRDPRGD